MASVSKAHFWKTLNLHKVLFCCIRCLNIRGGVQSPGNGWSMVPWWLLSVSPAVEGGQTRHTVLYIECMFVPALDAGLKASLKDALWKVNSITAFWQGEEGAAEEMVGMAMLLLSDAPLHPTPPLSPSFRDEGASLFPKLINKISRSTKTHVWSA